MKNNPDSGKKFKLFYPILTFIFSQGKSLFHDVQTLLPSKKA